MLTEKRRFLSAQIKINKLTPLQEDGILRAMDAFAEYYHSEKMKKNISPEHKCVAGCKHFTSSELKHHEDCPNYPDSMSEQLDGAISIVKSIHKIVDNRNLNAYGEPSYRKDSNS